MNKRALLIGAEADDLHGVRNDVEVMEDVLTELGFTMVLPSGWNATTDAIRHAYRGLIDDTTSGDAAVVYYAGHGGRYPNPAAGPGLPGWVQLLFPTDFTESSAEDARCILAEELSLLQLELTTKSENVTTILDCCHAARMSRDPHSVPRALPAERAGQLPDMQRRWRAVRDDPRWAEMGGVDSNPHAVRVVACSPDQLASERDSAVLGKCHGVLTAALVPVLQGADVATLTWRDVLGVVRGAVLDQSPGQRPEVEGPGGRLLFSAATRSAVGVRPVRIDEGEGTALLDNAAVFGMAPGDKYAIVGPGGDPATPLAAATVERIVGGRAVLHLDGATAADLPTGAAAWPVDVALGTRPVAVLPPDDPARPEVVDELTRTAQVRVVDNPAGTLATVRLDDGIQIVDSAGLPLYHRPRSITAARAAADVRALARATHVRELASGTGREELPDDVDVAWLRLRADGTEERLEEGTHLFVDDRLVVRATSRTAEKRFFSVIDVGVSGAVFVLTSAEPDGVTVAGNAVHELGRDWSDQGGIRLGWPEELSADGPRAETAIAIVADAKIDGLSGLEQPGVGSRSPVPPRTSLGALLDDLVVGRRDMRPRQTPKAVRYRVERLDFVMHPAPRADREDEPAFAVDERPDPSFRLVVPHAADVPKRVALRLRELTVSGDGTPPARVRVDALAITAVPAAAGKPYQVATAHRGHDEPVLDVVTVHEGPAGRFLDLAVWVTPEGSPEVNLGALLAAEETGDAEVAAAVRTLARLSAAAPEATDVARSTGAVAALVRAAARAIEGANGTSTGAYRTFLLPHQRFGAGRQPTQGLITAGNLSFTFEVVILDTV